MEQDKGWLAAAERCPSPNYNDRPGQGEVSLLLIHNISLPPGQFGGSCIRDFFCNRLDCDGHPYFHQLRDVEVSAHLLIERGGTLVQFVGFEKRAWHAGESSFHGVPDCNDYSIGIELEGTDQSAYTDAQYASLAQIAVALMKLYPAISLDRITGHSDVAPGRKTDPGLAFDWKYFRQQIVGVQQQT